MKVTINGTFRVKKSYQGKNNVFHTLEEFGGEYPLRVSLAHEDMIFQGVGKDQIIDMHAECDMREFTQGNGSKNTVFYIDKIDFDILKVSLNPVKV